MDYLPHTAAIMTESAARELNPLVLAFVGDSVQQLMVRTKLASTSLAKAGDLHRQATGEISAVAQAKAVDRVLPYFTEEEMSIYRRARNTKMSTMAKHASVGEYRKASGYEAVIGYLYLLGRNDRLSELMALSAEEN